MKYAVAMLLATSAVQAKGKTQLKVGSADLKEQTLKYEETEDFDGYSDKQVWDATKSTITGKVE